MFRNGGLEAPKESFTYQSQSVGVQPNILLGWAGLGGGGGSELFIQDTLRAITRYDMHPKVISKG